MLTTQAFVRQTLRRWHPHEKKIVPVPLSRDPRRLLWEHEAASRYPEALGEYTLNPAEEGVSYSQISPAQFQILNLPDFIGKPLWQVGAHLARTYGHTHLIPGITLWSSLLQNGRRATRLLQSPPDIWRAYFHFGSLIRHSNGYWNVPYAHWVGGQWSRRGNWLGDDWRAGCRVVLVQLPIAR